LSLKIRFDKTHNVTKDFSGAADKVRESLPCCSGRLPGERCVVGLLVCCGEAAEVN
jgi:hypothetical protein